MPDQINGGPAGYSIIVNAGEPYHRQRFTVAHEIAHFVLHRQQVQMLGNGITDDTFYRSTLSNAQEAEANRFAADVLMPYPLIQQLIATGISSVSQLASALQVSESAMKIRLGIPIP
jgi:Zn-dependent peptidase ImmA (M78 family)